MSKKPSQTASNIANNPALALNQKPQRRPDPIILLSPSASALLRMSNVKSFLENGRYTPPDHNSTRIKRIGRVGSISFMTREMWSMDAVELWSGGV